DDVWFYDVQADGWSLDDKRTALLPDDQLGPRPQRPDGEPVAFDPAHHDRNNLPDVLARWTNRAHDEGSRQRTDQSFMVPKAEIAANGYDLSINRYKEIVYEEVEHRPPLEIIGDLEKLEDEIQAGLAELKSMLH